MPEAFAVLGVGVVAVAAWFAAWAHGRNPANHNVQDETARLRHHAVWLADRIETARREKWGSEMVASLSHELSETSRRLEQANALGK